VRQQKYGPLLTGSLTSSFGTKRLSMVAMRLDGVVAYGDGLRYIDGFSICIRICISVRWWLVYDHHAVNIWFWSSGR
jgi:hypothetical protein